MKKTGYFCVIIAAILWGILGIFIKKLTASGFNTLQLVWIRAVGTSLALVLYMSVTNRKLLKFKLRDSVYFIGTGIISFTFFNLCYFVTINSTSLSVAAILLYTAQIFVMIFSSMLFKEKMTLKKLLSLILTFYHFKVNPPQGFRVQVMYNEDLTLDECHTIRNGDSIAIKEGYHPVAAAPGYQVYYLWVMAGNSGRILTPNDDPAHAWVKAVEAMVK